MKKIKLACAVMIQRCVDILKEELTEISIERKTKRRALINCRRGTQATIEQLNSTMMGKTKKSRYPRNIWASTADYLKKNTNEYNDQNVETKTEVKALISSHS